ncbi:MAG: HAMP domain-containing histidine kinase [Butyrivibrio sp.]|uniref:HAMP domain-containing sensor histidine kinase n=1 Tax=Butyrivibrio sp. TaxID=28121 RepID=UPI0025D60D09|nr:HAMP domain-containing sensor histidine kinase [Butyrivibrio sp.]MCR5770619.1 HAMP domain-containing histidine kinase [Butyrivibrio sp.]
MGNVTYNKIRSGKRNSHKKNNEVVKGFRWVYFMGTVIVVGSVMAYGLIGAIVFDFDDRSALTMLAMVPLMSFVYTMAMRPVIRKLSGRIEKITIAMDEVANGNLDYQIDTKKSGEFKKAYSQFNSMTLELKKTKQEMEDFTNEFAHEFKTPITAISGFSDHLLETGKDIETEERLEQLKMISEESRRLLALSMNTLLLSKVDAMQVVDNKEHYDLAEQLRRCVILLSKEMDKKDIDLEMDEDMELPFYGNEELLQHVWINILNNAVKFTPKGGTITIIGHNTDGEIVVSISDTGAGMDEKTMQKIFDKYYQNDSSSIARGSGIGLSIVKRIVVLCKGSIDVDSSIGNGTTFTVHLPLSDNI